MKIYHIRPVPKPRMVRSDAWKKRPAVTRYWDFKAHCKLLDLTLPEGAFSVAFVLAMPESWSAKKRAQMAGKPHRQKPDVDNMLKAIFDAVLADDCHIADVRASKWWGEKDCIVIEEIEPLDYPLTLG